VIRNFGEHIPSPYRVEKFDKKRRRGSLSYAMLFEEIHGGVVRASNPESIILVFSPNGVMWVAGFISEKRDSLHFPYHPTKLLNRETYAFKT
jgi:hypothetical protein